MNAPFLDCILKPSEWIQQPSWYDLKHCGSGNPEPVRTKGIRGFEKRIATNPRTESKVSGEEPLGGIHGFDDRIIASPKREALKLREGNRRNFDKRIAHESTATSSSETSRVREENSYATAREHERENIKIAVVGPLEARLQNEVKYASS